MSILAGRAGWSHYGAPEAEQRRLLNVLNVPGAPAAQMVTAPGLVLANCGGALAGRDGRWTVLFAGYLCNRADLAPDAGLPTTSDVDCVLALLQQRGADALTALDGGFALAAWDGESRRLHLVADTMGFRPLYYHQGDGWLVFSTWLPALLAWPGVPRDLDENRLIGDLLYTERSVSDSYFTAIRRVPAATVLTFDGDGPPKARITWEPDFTRRLSFPRNEDYVEAGREALDRAVAAHLPPAGAPVVCQMSGGLDSTAIAATAARLRSPAPVHTITAVPPPGATPAPWERFGPPDERPLAEAAATMHPNIRAHFLQGGAPHPLEDDPERVFRLTGAPRYNWLNNIWFMPGYEQARNLGAGPLLSGFLGNLVFSWGGRESQQSIVAARPWRQRLDDAIGYARLTGGGLPRQIWRWGVRPVLAGTVFDRRVVDPLLTLHPFNSGFLAGRDIRGPRTRCIMQRNDPAFLRQSLFTNTRRAADMIGLGDRMFGVERRFPFADRRLMTFCFAVPGEQYLRRGVTRSFARRVLADRLPPAVVDNQLYGVQSSDAPQRLIRQRAAVAARMEEVAGSALVNHIFDVPRMRALVAAWPTNVAEFREEHLAVAYTGLHYARFVHWVERGCPR